MIEDIIPETNDERVEQYARELQENEEKFEGVAKLFNLAGNPLRLKILHILTEKDNVCVYEFSQILGISISSASQHLRKLKDSGILRFKKKRQAVYYYINPVYKEKIKYLMQLLK